jgi:hypothetical protein
MTRAALLVAFFSLAPTLPEGCAKMLAKSKAQPSASAVPAAPPPTVQPPAPVTSATTPPVWAPPDTGGPAPAPVPAVSPDLAKARSLAQAGDHKKVRALLEKKVRAGKGSKEEAAILMESCIALRDKPCVDAVKAKYPEIE